MFFNAPLIEKCREAQLPIQIGGFVDDIHLLAYSRSTERNCEVLHKAHNICLRWAREHGASFAPQKYELVHLSRKPRRHNMAAVMSFEGTDIQPKEAVRVLGLHIDTKLRWGPHLAHLKAKMSTQELGLKCLAASTWGATLAKSRVVYTAVVRPMLTFAARIWHSPEGTKEAKRGRVQALAKDQNRCLRRVTGAYKSTPIPVLEAEAEIPPIDLQLDRLLLKSLTKGVHPAVERGCTRIWRRLSRKRRGRPREAPITPLKAKVEWSERTLVKAREAEINPRPEGEDQSKGMVLRWWKRRREKRWKDYQQSIYSRKHLAQEGELWGRLAIHKDLTKAESSAAIQLRSGHIGLRSYLHKMRVPGYESPACPCGWSYQDPKHILFFCKKTAEGRQELINKAPDRTISRLLSTPKGIGAAAKWVIQSGMLGQYALAKIQLYGPERATEEG